LAFGTEFRKWQQELLFQYTSAVYDQSVSQGRLQLPAYGIIDWNTRYQYTPKGHLFARIDNLLAKEYAVSWRPFGLRPGKPQSLMVGIEQIF
jgi:Fe(3+) dicitrate transport protein